MNLHIFSHKLKVLAIFACILNEALAEANLLAKAGHSWSSLRSQDKLVFFKYKNEVNNLQRKECLDNRTHI